MIVVFLSAIIVLFAQIYLSVIVCRRGITMKRNIRICLSVGEVGRYISHLDVLRTMQRAIRRSRLPIVYSAGFNPIPKIAFASALPVGVTSEAEYADLQMQNPIAVAEVKDRLNQVLPGGFQIKAAVELPDDYRPLMAVVQAAVYWIKVLKAHDNLNERIAEFLELEECFITIERKKKKTMAQKDIRKLIYQLSYIEQEKCIYLECGSGINGNLRPMDLLPFLDLELTDVLIHRTALLVRAKGDRLVTPFQVIKE